MTQAKWICAALLGGALLAAPVAATAKTKAVIGTLTCSGGGGAGLVLGSKKSYRCSFQEAGSKRKHSYHATTINVGLDIGVTGKTVMIWTVLAGAKSIRPGLLSGNYVGAAADASLGIGGGAKVLVGGLNNAIVLQPISVQGQSGMNIAVGVTSMTLR